MRDQNGVLRMFDQKVGRIIEILHQVILIPNIGCSLEASIESDQMEARSDTIACQA